MANIRKSGARSPKKRLSVVALTPLENNKDDKGEKKRLQLERLQQLHQKGVTPNSTPTGDRRKSLNTCSGFSYEEITNHYFKCIQLSTENKINTKNAFNLQLIDCMTEFVKKKDANMNNFQLASCTLDASTKIYGYRVDSVHTDTLRMAGGLGSTKNQMENDADVETQENGKISSKKKKKTRNTVEKNLKNLNSNNLELDINLEADPMFKKRACQFVEAASGDNLFINIYPKIGLTSQIALDSDAVVWGGEYPDAKINDTKCSIPNFREDIFNLKICETFATFEFSNWNINEDDTFFDPPHKDKTAMNENLEADEHAFDINAVPEPIEDDEFHDHAGGVSDNENIGDETAVTIGGAALHQSHASRPHKFEILQLGEHLAPSEYSYFDQKVLSAWAGPKHWKFKALKCNTSDKPKSSSKSKKKEFSMNFELERLDRLFNMSTNSIKLTQNTILNWSQYNTTVSVYQPLDQKIFYELYDCKEILIRSKGMNVTVESTLADDVTNDFTATTDNTAFTNNYDNYRNEDDTQCDLGSQPDTTANNFDDVDLFSQTVMPTAAVDLQQDFLGNNLVEAPNKVNLVNVAYAKTAKKMDMKKLKSTMWNLYLQSSIEPNKENFSDNNQEHNNNSSKLEHTEKKFRDLYCGLSKKLSKSMSENLSPQLALVALLHLANENDLELIQTDPLSDINVVLM